MSRHEGVSCDSCLKGNFRGKRFKCLVCYDYDLCATCFDAGTTTTRHSADHAMQCILTRTDSDLYYAGEALIVEQPQSYTCPICGKMGYTELTLQEHCAAEHPDSSLEVVCPICAAVPGGDPNNITDDFPSHIALEHRSSREEESAGSRHIRRIPHPGRGIASAGRPRRTQMQFTSSSALSALSPGSNRESMDPISELLSQLSGVRRTINLAQSTTSQLQQLQLQLERQQAQAARQQLERLPRRQGQTSSNSSSTTSSTLAATTATTSTAALATPLAMANSSSLQSQYAAVLEPFPSPSSNSSGSKFLLSRCMDTIHSELELQRLELENEDRSLFIQELLLCALTEDLSKKLECCDIGFIGHIFDSCTSETTAHHATASKKETPALQTKVISPGVMSPSATIPPHHQWTSQTQQTGSSHHHSQSSRNVPARKSNSSSVRHSGRTRGGTSGVNHPQPPRELGLPSARGGATSYIQQVSPRDGLASNRHVARATARETGPSPSATRRKVLRQVDDRNKYTEPPPH